MLTRSTTKKIADVAEAKMEKIDDGIIVYRDNDEVRRSISSIIAELPELYLPTEPEPEVKIDRSSTLSNVGVEVNGNVATQESEHCKSHPPKNQQNDTDNQRQPDPSTRTICVCELENWTK